MVGQLHLNNERTSFLRSKYLSAIFDKLEKKFHCIFAKTNQSNQKSLYFFRTKFVVQKRPTLFMKNIMHFLSSLIFGILQNSFNYFGNITQYSVSTYKQNNNLQGIHEYFWIKREKYPYTSNCFLCKIKILF